MSSVDLALHCPFPKKSWFYGVLQPARNFIGPLHVLISRRPAPFIMRTLLVLGSIDTIQHMVKRPSKSQPSWTDVKAKLASFDRTGLLDLIHDLYAAHKDNQTFLHTRFGLCADVLKPYKQTIDRWLWPDVLRKQDTSVNKAKQAIANYKKAVGERAGLAELMAFYCERAAGVCSDICIEDESYFAALVRMFEQALTITNTLPASSRDALISRLDGVHGISQKFGYGVGDDMDFILAKYTKRRA